MTSALQMFASRGSGTQGNRLAVEDHWQPYYKGISQESGVYEYPRRPESLFQLSWLATSLLYRSFIHFDPWWINTLSAWLGQDTTTQELWFIHTQYPMLSSRPRVLS